MIDLMAKRNYFFFISLVLIIAGIAGYFINGIQLDIQFQGGTIIRVQMDDDKFDTARIESALKSALNKNITAQKLKRYNPQDADKQMDMLMLKVSSEDTLSDIEFTKVMEILRADFGVKTDAQMDMQSVRPFIGREMMANGIKAAVIASLLILAYVWWRFSVMSGLPAAITAIAALLHDAAVMFSVYILFKIPVNELFVAAILAILGYSINDTIIVYDRVRENSSLLRKTQSFEIMNRSILQTLSRSINTLVTTLVCIITVYVFAYVNNIQSLKDFCFPLTVGLVSGGYSSIFIAGPLWAMWRNSQVQKKLPSKAKAANVR